MVGAHVFDDPAWQEALARAAPDAFRSFTFPKLQMPPDAPYRVGSPIMDRLSARYYALELERPVLRRHDALPAPAGR